MPNHSWLRLCQPETPRGHRLTISCCGCSSRQPSAPLRAGQKISVRAATGQSVHHLPHPGVFWESRTPAFPAGSARAGLGQVSVHVKVAIFTSFCPCPPSAGFVSKNPNRLASTFEAACAGKAAPPRLTHPPPRRHLELSERSTYPYCPLRPYRRREKVDGVGCTETRHYSGCDLLSFTSTAALPDLRRI